MRISLDTPTARLFLAASVVMAIVSGAANIAALEDPTTESARQLALHAATVPCLVFALIARACAASSERRFHLADQRLLADPSRVRWLAGKAAVSTGIGAVYGAIGALTAIAVARLAFTARDVEFDLTDGSVLRSLIGVVLAAATFSAIGGAVGALTTNTPMIVALLLAWVLVVEPPTVLGVPAFGRLLPAAGALALTRSPDPDLLPPVWGGVSMTVFLLVALWFAQRRLRRADL